jgi:hypothetical protein
MKKISCRERMRQRLLCWPLLDALTFERLTTRRRSWYFLEMTEEVETEDEKLRPEIHALALYGSSCALVAYAHAIRL